MAVVGFFFAAFVLACWYWQEHGAPKRAARARAREECQRIGHDWGDSFWAMGSRMRNCRRCKRQQHQRDGEWF